MPRNIVKSAVAKNTKSPSKELVKEEKNIDQKDTNSLDFSMFKFEKKPHVKIEFETDSPEKEDSKGLWEPANWKEFLINLRNMRSNNDAPVDSMGCHMAMDENAPPKVMRYQSLIALMLSSQTKDQVTFAAMERLREKGLNVDNVLNMSDEELGKLIYPVGFWKTKVKYIKKTTQTLKEQYDGDIPDSVDKLCKLTGVGPKMAHICMQVAWKKTTGIGVDTHVHRISNRIGWVKKPTSTPEDTRKALQSWLPFDLWSEVNHLMVGFGQTICQPVSPLCHECLNRDICPSSGLGRKSPNKKSPLKQNVKTEIKVEMLPLDENKPAASLVKRKTTPKKNNADKPANQKLSDNLTPEDNPSSRKRKVTPKKNETQPSNEISEDVIDERIVLPVPLDLNKRKVSPKKVTLLDDEKEGEIGMDEHDKINIKKSPKKSKLLSKNENEINDNNIVNTNVINKKSPNKRKVSNFESVNEPGTFKPNEVQNVVTMKAPRKTKSSLVPGKMSEPTQVKRKSPRVKNKLNSDAGETEK